ncbi:MAG: glycerol-3-phosphate dehydrogenase/oxidase [Alphaproteobacteria bacterium]|nr:glycerol-3-phosphate dehydrogenase/oxidase [Alphaproteobacteria bacterium]MBU6472876.1 glycerol-3-phosphate dehydrogenase/oxidase [Alphaproteobacteria bacterium]MDE2011591.1 glycerol-3-phosphate dehydrogenase/oxidase [Alphaproteobacteria bacterium]MDE2071937.1 glycerol-3-phosphate dehydrogenase/oxidase [Alphaproteobacteria bacterium]MDE2353059.1 glycerol-3-phosphate dehydrogenase/oxidase [Alphaproteobacteria bacterium]
MRRDPARLANEDFDLLVIGGGVTGACVARDAALRGLKVALVEKNDFAHATSAHNSKLIHGGLRYLKNFELRLVRESLRARRIWQKIAPHLVRPLPFLIPFYNSGWAERAVLGAGLSLYDLLSYDRGWLDDPDQRLPGHSSLGTAKAAELEPALAADGFQGALLYYDAQMYAPERLALENLASACMHDAVCVNHVAAENLLIREGRVEGAQLADRFGGAKFDVRAKLTLLATGPWSDLFLEQALGKPAKHKLVRSKGIHLIVPAMTRNHALTVAAKHGHFFILPWRGHSLLGTTDTRFTLPPDQAGVTESDIESFLAFINAHLPVADLKRSDVEHFYAGLRPLVDDGSGDTYGASRRSELIDHGKSDGLDGLYSAVGGKWTTSRELAQSVTDTIVAKLGATALPCTTARMRLPGGWIDNFANLVARARHAQPDLAVEHLLRLYGTRLTKVLELASDPALRRPLSASGDIGAQVLYAVREEMAMTLEDVVMRRTGIGQLGDPGAEAINSVADLMAGELGWDRARRDAEIVALAKNFRTRPEAEGA